MSGRVKPRLSQQQRLTAAVLYFVALLALSTYLTGSLWPPYGIDGLWFYSAAAALLLGEFVLEPFFTRPADALASGLAILLAASTVSLDRAEISATAAKWGRLGVICAALVIIALAVVAIAFKDTMGKRQRAAEVATSAVAHVGRARWQFSALLLLSGYAAFADSAGKVAALFGIWIVIFVVAPAEEILSALTSRRGNRPPRTATVEAIEDPGIIIARLPSGESAQLGAAVQFRPGVSGTVVEVTRLSEVPRIRIALDESAPVAVGTSVEITQAQVENPTFGHVAEGTTLDEILVDSSPIAAALGLEEGRLAEASVGKSATLYQVIGAEVVKRADPDLRRYLVRVRARKVGRWDEERTVFEPVGWIPAPGAPVRLLATVGTGGAFVESAIGRVPGTTYAISVDSHLAVTHNTAILGILGIGKTHLAWELIKRMLVDGIKVVALDITGGYAQHFADVCSPETEDAIAHEIEGRIASNHANRVVRDDEAGNLRDFLTAMLDALSRFVESDQRLLILNPNRFEVTRMEGRPFSGEANLLARLTMVDVTRIIAEQLLGLLQARDRDPADESAVLCLVLEEAHSLVPEWTSAASDSERQAVNGSARAILQGRKYGYGCLLITQRTANVTKSILNQCNTVFGMRVYDATGMGFLENYIGPTYAPTLASLRDRQAVVFGRASSCNSPIIVDLNDAGNFYERYWAPRANTIPQTQPPAP